MRCVCWSLLIAMVSVTAASAAPIPLVNIDVESPGGPTYAGAGAAPGAGTFWNSLALGGGSNLLASDGTTATTVDVAFAGFSGHFTYDGANALMYDRIYGPQVGTAFIDITGLNPAATYDLYVYSSFWNAIYSVTGLTPEMATGNSQHTTWTEGDQYVLLAGASPDGTGMIRVSVSAGAADQWTVISGLQIAETAAASPVPEPATLSLLGGALAALDLRRRRRARTTSQR